MRGDAVSVRESHSSDSPAPKRPADLAAAWSVEPSRMNEKKNPLYLCA